MRVGFVLECGEDGAEHAVFKYLVAKLRPAVTPVFVFMNNKGALFRGCAAKVEGLFDIERCVRVFVVWDLIPPEVLDAAKKKSCKAERAELLAKLRPEDRSPERTTLLCISQELEAWLLADGTAIDDFLFAKKASTHRDKKPIADDKKPEREPNPKKRIGKLFDEARGGSFEYSDIDHAIEIVKRANLSKYERAPSFARFKAKLAEL